MVLEQPVLTAQRATVARRQSVDLVWPRHLIIPCVLLVGLLGLYLSNQHFVESTDTVGNELLPLSVLRYGSLTFDQYYARANSDGSYPTGEAAIVQGSVPADGAYRVLPEVPEKSFPWWFLRINGHTVSLYPILPGLLNTPVFLVASWLGVDLDTNIAALTRVTTALLAALSVLATYLALVQVCAKRGTAVYLTLAFALGTAVWSANSRSLYQHGAATLFIAAGLAALLTRRPHFVALAGLCFGLAFATRPTNAIIAAAIALYVLRHERRSLPGFIALGAIPVIALTWYSWVYLGTPFALGQGQGLSGFSGTEWAVAFVGLLISPNRGLLVFSPIFFFSVAYAVWSIRRRQELRLLSYVVWSSLGLVAMYSLWMQWPGGHTYGYRFLIELTPGLMLLLAAAWPTLIEPRPYLRALFLVALLASMYIHGLGAEASPCGFDDEPNEIDFHHERLWDVANGEIARCTRSEVSAFETKLAETGAA